MSIKRNMTHLTQNFGIDLCGVLPSLRITKLIVFLSFGIKRDMKH